MRLLQLETLLVPSRRLMCTATAPIGVGCGEVSGGGYAPSPENFGSHLKWVILVQIPLYFNRNLRLFSARTTSVTVYCWRLRRVRSNHLTPLPSPSLRAARSSVFYGSSRISGHFSRLPFETNTGDTFSRISTSLNFIA